MNVQKLDLVMEPIKFFPLAGSVKELLAALNGR